MLSNKKGGTEDFHKKRFIVFILDLPQVYFQRVPGRHTALREIYLQDPTKKRWGNISPPLLFSSLRFCWGLGSRLLVGVLEIDLWQVYFCPNLLHRSSLIVIRRRAGRRPSLTHRTNDRSELSPFLDNETIKKVNHNSAGRAILN